MLCRFFSLRGWLVDELDESVVYAHPCMHRIDGLARRGAPPFRHQDIVFSSLFCEPKSELLAPAIVHMAEHKKSEIIFAWCPPPQQRSCPVGARVFC